MKNLILVSIVIAIVSSCSFTGKKTYNWENGNIFIDANYIDDIPVGSFKVFYPNKDLFCEMVYEDGYLIKKTLHPYQTNYYEEHFYKKIENEKLKISEISHALDKSISKIYYRDNLISAVFFNEKYGKIDSLIIYDSSYVRLKKFAGGEAVPKDLHIFHFKYYFLNYHLESIFWMAYPEASWIDPESHLEKYFKNVNNEYVAKIMDFKNGTIQNNNRESKTPLTKSLERYIEDNDGFYRKGNLNYFIYHYHQNGNIKEIIPLQAFKASHRSEVFTIDGYIREYDEQGNLVRKVKYINGQKMNDWL